MRSRYANRDRVAGLDPLVDFHAIYSNLAREDFPWDVTRALELALYRTFCIPSIAALLDQTGEFRYRTQRRYDDTALLLGEILELGTETPEGRAAVSRLNRIHARFEISNDDFLYTLATFVFVPLRWLDRWGWRPLLAVEREAAFRYYARLGQLMGISGIPSTLAEFEDFFDAFERQHFAYGEPQARTAVATRELLASWLPAPLAPAVRLGVNALLDGPVRAAFGFPDPPRWLPPTVSAGLHARARVERLLPPRRRPTRTRESRLIRSYPDGFTVADLGPQDAEPVAG
jgi:hypothetical protein